MKYDQDKKARLLLGFQMAFMVVMLYLLGRTQFGELDKKWILIVLVVFIAYMYYKFDYMAKTYVTVAKKRTKGFGFFVRAFPIFPIIAYIGLPRENYLNAITAGVLFAVDTLLKEKLNYYFTPEEYQIFKREQEKKRRAAEKNNN